MNELLLALPYIGVALVVVALLNTGGAIASRIFNFNFGYLSILSFAIYISLGYLIATVASFLVVVIGSLIVGFFDATAGMKLSRMFRANFGEAMEMASNITYSQALAVVLFIAPVFAGIGYLIR